jgi:hypothetical protein
MRIYSSPDVVVDEQKPCVLVVTASIGNVLASAKFPDIPSVGERKWSMVLPGTPNAGPFGNNAMVYHDEYVTTDVVACAPEQGWVIRSIRHQAARQRPCRRRQRPPGRGDRGLDLRAAARQQLGTLGDPADQLTPVETKMTKKALRLMPRRLLYLRGSIVPSQSGIMVHATG